ncbi:hypothetical protein L6N32_004227 [Salmonella enterica subsp. enterica serovar Poona]|uniref:hypothetical protein n=1 Tax=Salmonella enterica TaxID=28901 RepID=UPI00159007B3|nr:hypothetical protein [Salmonella enterica]EIU8085043.1 hypothetical protein [Salmonella enterica subsp. enterica serovar Poona]QVB78762.1 hypothetical protein JYM78_23100 [Salmonella enterica subsp. enterica serovar Rubislaw]EHL8497687.1 hypothetical protein [Salmonella enterica]EID1118269.1 hypothetical protein [Salmonella enterica]EIV1956017.1 hypothetical protein [Salmonella enterica subsp. enterica serovar Poona]
MKIVFHISERSRSILCRNNVRNYLNQTSRLQEDSIKMVFNADAVISLILGDESAERWRTLCKQHPCMQLSVCDKPLNVYALSPDHPIGTTEVIPAAAVALAEISQSGWIVAHNTDKKPIFAKCTVALNLDKIYMLYLLILILIVPLPAGATDTQITLQCDGRGAVTVVLAEYGLITESWPPAFFETGIRIKDEHFTSGKAVAVWRFSNGDLLYQVKGTPVWFALYRGDSPGTLRRCILLSNKELQPVDLPRVPDR